eukprot:TRINITY_DN6490_c0_g1_i1.p1 TRINITY_DN6490_c0_g1~~TRINITY_DN6490_c0_g1_i1.p1  ORF type:complete len:458 (+),score=105.06 TRINITY_DN6490_c0_g1_i1:3-1376(+)
MESRQVLLDRRLAEFSGMLQGIQEEQYAHTSSLERGQKALACSAKRALQTAVTVQKSLEEDRTMQACLSNIESDGSLQHISFLQGRIEEQQASIRQLGDWIAQVARGHPGSDQVPYSLGYLFSDGRPRDKLSIGSEDLVDRIVALEKGQKAVASSARRALHTALVVHQKQESQDQEDEFGKCLGIDHLSGSSEAQPPPLPSASTTATTAPEIQNCVERIVEQDERLEKILQVVDVLADKVQETGASIETLKLTDGKMTGSTASDVVGSDELREKIEDLQANLYGLAAQVQSQAQMSGPALLDRQEQQQQQQRTTESLTLAMESMDEKVKRSLAEISHRLDIVEETCDENQIHLRQLKLQLPEATQRLDQLWEQCQKCFPRMQEQEVHFSFLRNSFEAHKQQMFELWESSSGASKSADKSRYYSNGNDEHHGTNYLEAHKQQMFELLESSNSSNGKPI